MKKIIKLLFVLLSISSYSVYASDSNESLNELITNFQNKQEQEGNTDKDEFLGLLILIPVGLIIPLGLLIVHRKKFHSGFANRVLFVNAFFILLIAFIMDCFWRYNFFHVPRYGTRSRYEAPIIAIAISTFIGKLMLTEFDKNDDLLS